MADNTHDRARRRAIRALAAREGVPYSVAARRLSGLEDRAEEAGDYWKASFGVWLPRSETPARVGMVARHGRTVYPDNGDAYRRALIEARGRWTFAERVADTRRAADLPVGRARHLAGRFPPTRGEAGTGVGPLYNAEGLEEALALAYLVAAHEAPECVPSLGELAWAAEMGEETAVDTVCGDLDRKARSALDLERLPALPSRASAALTAALRHTGTRVRDTAARLAAWHAGEHGPHPFGGAGQVLDALLVVAEDGHAPGTRVETRAGRRKGTIVGALWGAEGPPSGYLVQVDGGERVVATEPDDLTLA